MNQNLPLTILNLAPERSHRTALRKKQGQKWIDISWKDFQNQVHRFASSLLSAGLNPGEPVAIMSGNSPEWAYADLAIMACGGLTVPVYHTEGPEAVQHILKDSGSRFLFIRSQLAAKELLPLLDELPKLEKIVLLEDHIDHPKTITLEQFLHMEESAVDLNCKLAEVKRDDLATIIYTSGTTGPPKGVMLTHGNMLSAVEAAQQAFDIGTDDSCLSFLPLSHVFERVDGYYFMLIQGATINYAENIDSVPANLQEVSPTIVISVPRLFEKMFARVMERITSGPWLKKQLFFGALKACSSHLQQEQAGEEPSALLSRITHLAREKVFSKLRTPLGGKIRFFVSGGAPLARNVSEFFHAAGLPIYEGYGLTETSAGITVNSEGQVLVGSVGRCMDGTEIQVAGDGEILIRGRTLFQGYWQNPEKTADVLKDGWFHTGDIGTLDAAGFLTITDRKKDLIITAGGENIAPQLIENQLKTDKFVANAFVFGNNKPYLVALIVPNFDNLESYAKLKKLPYLDHCGLVSHPQVLDLIRRRVDQQQAGLPGFQHIKRFTLISRDFEGDEITPTMKLKRKIVRQRYEKLIEGMYLAKGHATHDAGFCVIAES